MKILVRVFIAIAVLFFLKMCFGIFYIRMTHLSKEDLEWVDGIKNHPYATFESDSGNTSRLMISSVRIANSSNPFYISSSGSFYYEANAWYRFTVEDSARTLSGAIGIVRLIDNDSLCGHYYLGAMFSPDTPKILKPQSFLIKDILIDNCLIIDSTMAKNSPHWKNKPLQLMDRFVISRDYGLIYYKLESGEEFFRRFE